MAGEPFWFEKKFAGPIYGFPSEGKKYGKRRRNALKIKRKRVFLLAVLIVTAFSGCSANIVRKYPDSGVWYCEALHMEIDFSKTGHKNVKLYTDENTYIELSSFMDYFSRIIIENEEDGTMYLTGEYYWEKDGFYVEAENNEKCVYRGGTYIFIEQTGEI